MRHLISRPQIGEINFNVTRVYLKDSNAAELAVNSDIFYAVIHLPARSKTCALTFISQSSVKS